MFDFLAPMSPFWRAVGFVVDRLMLGGPFLILATLAWAWWRGHIVQASRYEEALTKHRMMEELVERRIWRGGPFGTSPIGKVAPTPPRPTPPAPMRSGYTLPAFTQEAMDEADREAARKGRERVRRSLSGHRVPPPPPAVVDTLADRAELQEQEAAAARYKERSGLGSRAWPDDELWRDDRGNTGGDSDRGTDPGNPDHGIGGVAHPDRPGLPRKPEPNPLETFRK
jgi:hypothetical protein